MPSPLRLLVASLALIGLTLAGCKKESCLGNDEGCRVASPCEKLSYSCEAASGSMLEVRTLTPEDRRAGSNGPGTGTDTVPGGLNALGARGDILLSNDRAVAVLAGIGNTNLLDPNGGSLLDLSARGKNNDGLNQVLQVVGILPGDAAHYTSMKIIDERPTRVAVQFSGTLDGKPEFPIHTLYEMRPCEPGIRVRTEVLNTAVDPQLWALSDGFYWSGREALPFTPSEGSGYQHPSFSLLTIGDAFKKFPYLTAAMASDPASSYAHVACGEANLLEGFQSDQISSSGLPRTVVQPRDYLVFERFLAVSERGDVAAAADLALEARQKLHGEKYVTLSGMVTRNGAPVGTGREASVIISEGELSADPSTRVPWTQVTPDKEGRFQARVPAGRDYVVELHAFGRKVADRQLDNVKADTDVGTLAVSTHSRLTVNVVDWISGVGLNAEVFLVPVNATTQKDTEGTLHGRFGTCAPWLGPPPGPSPACNRFLVHNGTATVDAPAGTFYVYAFKGPFWTIDRETVTLGAQNTTVELVLHKLALQPLGTVGADLHVHGAASFDSSIPDEDRVLSFAATDLDVIVSTDHDIIYDYGQVVRRLGLQNKMSAVVGLETTGHILWMKRPGSTLPLVVGHYNFWPLEYDPTKPRNGAPADELVEPGELFDRVKDSAPASLRDQLLVQLNHPWSDAEFGRDLGYPRALALDTTKNLPSRDDGTSSGMYVRTPKGGFANNGQHAQEVMNGTQNDMLLPYRAFWFYTLSQGQLAAGTANSDSHSLTDNTAGVPRNIVYANTTPGTSFDTNVFNKALKAGDSFGTNGPVIEATVDTASGRRRFGFSPLSPPADAKLHIRVSAAPWVPVEEVRIVVNGTVVKTIGSTELSHPTDPLGPEGVAELVRYDNSLALSELLTGVSGDAWLVVEAGARLPLAADFGGPGGDKPDGIPDTSDNNGDGKVDRADIAEGSNYGPLRTPTPPTSEASSQFHFSQVVTGGYPMSFTNPFLLDRNGNGRFDAPGVAAK
ncbi:CehA/McbA family metallohydrolase [Archangium lansingense]|uniref:CehA/McbA family metallohydrolase n=1 Tax=Archangium lansingense TaxID=2995310 RepID=A0ABT4A5N8_9BACT|nr:CehA/McbA family metallohydrolase [Archangium lansinium]MCY1076955.1 CehA/McbA family metallohydrolase [Archangium lansinium]